MIFHANTPEALRDEIVRDLRRHVKLYAEISEPGHERWKAAKARYELLVELVTRYSAAQIAPTEET